MNKRRKVKTTKLKRYGVIVSFINEGVVYGSEKMVVHAVNRRAAREQARKRAQSSIYNDERIPDREIKITVEEA